MSLSGGKVNLNVLFCFYNPAIGPDTCWLDQASLEPPDFLLTLNPYNSGVLVLESIGGPTEPRVPPVVGISATHPISDSPLVTDSILKHLAVFKTSFHQIGIGLFANVS